MIVCRECGHENDDSDAFCGSCGAFLEWAGEAVDGQDGEGPAGAVAAATEAAAAEAAAVEEERAAAEAARAAAEEARQRAEAEAQARRRAEEEAAARARAEEEAARRAEAEAAARAERDRERQAAEEARARLQETEGARKDAEKRAGVAAEATRRTADSVAAVDVAPAVAAEAVRASADEQAGATAELEATHRNEVEARAEVEAHQRSSEVASRRAAEEAEARAEAERVAAARARAEAEAQRQAEAESRARADAEVVARAQEAARAEAEATAKARAEANRRAAALLAKPPRGTTTKARPTLPQPEVGGDGAPEGRTAESGDTAPAEPVAGDVHVAIGRQPEPRQPDSRQPGESRRPRPRPEPRPASRPIQPGDLICGQCGEANASDRRFCRRCGASLVEVVPVTGPPWWRRVFRERTRVHKAGERRRRQRRRRGVPGVKKLVAAAVVAVLGFAAVPRMGPVRNPVHTWAVEQKRSVKKLLKPTITIVRPVAATATSADPEHPPGLVIDGKKNTFWAAARGTPADGAGQAVVVTFDRPITLSHVGFYIGPLGDPANFLTQPRPSKVQVVLLGTEGNTVSTKDITLADKADFQKFRLSGNGVSKVQVKVAEVNRSPQGGTQVSVAELEFYERK